MSWLVGPFQATDDDTFFLALLLRPTTAFEAFEADDVDHHHYPANPAFPLVTKERMSVKRAAYIASCLT